MARALARSIKKITRETREVNFLCIVGCYTIDIVCQMHRNGKLA